MTTLSARQLAARDRWQPVRPGAECSHPAGMYCLVDVNQVQRICRSCGRPFADPEPRCASVIRDGSRRCLSPGRQGGLCRVHRLRLKATD